MSRLKSTTFVEGGQEEQEGEAWSGAVKYYFCGSSIGIGATPELFCMFAYFMVVRNTIQTQRNTIVKKWLVNFTPEDICDPFHLVIWVPQKKKR